MNLSKTKTIPVAPAAGGQFKKGDIAITVHRSIRVDGRTAAILAAPETVTDSLNPILTLADLGGDIISVEDTLMTWTHTKRLAYVVKDFVDDGSVSELATNLVALSAYPGSDNSYTVLSDDVDGMYAARILEMDQCISPVACASAPQESTSWRFTPRGCSQVMMLETFGKPVRTFEPRNHLPLEQRTTFELMNVMVRDWTWAKYKANAIPAPYQPGGEKMWYTSTGRTTVCRPYLLALLNADTVGTVPHARTINIIIIYSD